MNGTSALGPHQRLVRLVPVARLGRAVLPQHRVEGLLAPTAQGTLASNDCFNRCSPERLRPDSNGLARPSSRKRVCDAYDHPSLQVSHFLCVAVGTARSLAPQLFALVSTLAGSSGRGSA